MFDLGKLLGGPAFEPNAGSVVLVLSLDDQVMGVLVESVSDIIQVQAAGPDAGAARRRRWARRAARCLRW